MARIKANLYNALILVAPVAFLLIEAAGRRSP